MDRNSGQPWEERVEALLAKMTLEEKVGQLNQAPAPVDAVEDLCRLARAGEVGSLVLATSAYAGSEEQQVAGREQYNAVQRAAVEESRLGIPLLFGRDVVHGHRTIFPIPLGQAAAWDADLVQGAARASAVEASAAGIRWTFAPVVDIARDPRWGRVAEGFGEDPCLAGVMAAAAVRGFQGNDPAAPDSILACLKHFLGYGAAEGGRDYNTAEISDHTLRNVYLPPFEAGIAAGAGSVMAAFHEIGGVPCSGSRYLMTQLLRWEMGFSGIVVSDWNSIGELQEHGVAGDLAEAAVRALWAGVDIDMCSNAYSGHIAEAVRTGALPGGALDDAVRRVLRTKFLCGLFERPYAEVRPPAPEIAAEHRALARRFVAHSLVLLKNDGGLLPLRKSGLKLAVLGPLADARRELCGTWAIDAVVSDTVTVLEGIRAAAPDVEIVTGGPSSDFDLVQASNADAVLMVVGEHHLRSGENASLADLQLPPGQADLIHAVRRLGKPVVAVICAGRPLVLTEIEPDVDSLVYAWHPGVEGGNAIVDVLFGDAAPTGRLPITFPRHIGQIPLYYNHKPTGRPTEGRYLDMPTEPLYPFGYGLTYTAFSYGPPALDPAVIPVDGDVRISVDVTNTGDRAGEEVVQLYLRDCVAEVTRPVRELKAFQRIALAPGETRTVTFTLGPADLSYVGPDHVRRVEPGEFRVWIGGDSRAAASAAFRVVAGNAR